MKIIWTNGCFDIMHPGHIELFKAAKALGDRLIVGVDTDEKISSDKGRIDLLMIFVSHYNVKCN